jgi:mannose-6-phosphate isomerase-like protein (cupin superfamily)
MKQGRVRFNGEFDVLMGNARSQAAELVIAPGQKEGGPDNRHKGADQWLFVLSGKGVAVVNGKSHNLRKWALVLIERGDKHEIKNNGTTPLKTLNFYVPPAYTKDSDELGVGKA